MEKVRKGSITIKKDKKTEFTHLEDVANLTEKTNDLKKYITDSVKKLSDRIDYLEKKLKQKDKSKPEILERGE